MNTLNYEQDLAEKLGELGAKLQQVREQKLMSLEQVAAKTMIQPRLLNAIEQGKLEQLPEPVYTQGFIRRFAEALGLDGAEFASAFPAKPGVQRRSPTWKQLPAAPLHPIHLYVLYVVLIVAAASGLSYLTNRSTPTTQPAPQSQAPTQAAATSKTPSQANAPSATGSEKTATPAQKPPVLPNQPLKVGVTLQQDSWMEVIADGKRQFEGVLPSGTKRTWTAKENLTVKAGNAGGVLVTYNDAQAKPMGANGAVEELTIRAKDVVTSPRPSASPVAPQPAASSAVGQ